MASTGDLIKQAVTGAKVRDGSLRPGDVDGAVARPHGGATTTSGTNALASYPLDANAWTQPAGELQVVSGTVTYRVPATLCELFSTPGVEGNGTVEISMGGPPIGSAVLAPAPLSSVQTSPIVTDPTAFASGPPVLYPPRTNASRTLTASIADNCDSEDFEIISTDLQVTGVG